MGLLFKANAPRKTILLQYLWLGFLLIIGWSQINLSMTKKAVCHSKDWACRLDGWWTMCPSELNHFMFDLSRILTFSDDTQNFRNLDNFLWSLFPDHRFSSEICSKYFGLFGCHFSSLPLFGIVYKAEFFLTDWLSSFWLIGNETFTFNNFFIHIDIRWFKMSTLLMR